MSDDNTTTSTDASRSQTPEAAGSATDTGHAASGNVNSPPTTDATNSTASNGGAASNPPQSVDTAGTTSDGDKTKSSTADPAQPAHTEDSVSDSSGTPSAPSDPPTVKLSIKAITMQGDDLAGLKTVLLSDGKLAYQYTTGSDGTLPELSFSPGCELCVMVGRFDGTLKQIHSMTVPGADAQITLVSPSFIVPASTEQVEGSPGETHKQAPQYEQGDYGQLKEPGDTDPPASGAGQAPSGTTDEGAQNPAPTTSESAAGSDSSQAAKPATPQAPDSTNMTSKPASGNAKKAAPVAAVNKTNSSTTATKKKKPVATTTPKPPASATNAQQQPVVGRDENGNPIAVFVHKVQDWWGSWHAPSMHLWGGGFVPVSALPGRAGTSSGGPASSRSTGAATASANSAHAASASAGRTAGPHATSGTVAHAGSRPASSGTATSQPASRASAPTQPASSATGGTVRPGTEIRHHQEMVDKLAALFDFCEKQLHYLYPGSTVSVLTTLANGTFAHQDTEKTVHDSKGWCYKYVKVALKYCQIVDTVLGGEGGSEGGPHLLSSGFVDVTNRVPDHRWAAAGDVIVHSWSEGTWESRRRSHHNPHLPNYGHIEIRHTEHYYSDFRPVLDRQGKLTKLVTMDGDRPHHNADGTVATTLWPEYVNIRIYRKFYDIIPTLRIKAFLRCIRDFECESQHDDARRYNMLNVHLPVSTSHTFDGYETHPWANVPLDQHPRRDSGTSTASGAYQITWPTWHGIIYEKLQIFNEQHWFTPEIQDRMAVIIIESMPDRVDARNPDAPNALTDVRAGRIEDAVRKIANQWASLPGGVQNSRRLTPDRRAMDMSYFMTLFNQHLNEEKIANGL